MSNSTLFEGLPFALCAHTNNNLKEIHFGGTKAAVTLDWSGQLGSDTNTSFDADSLNSACLNALQSDDVHVRKLSLAAITFQIWDRILH